MHAEERHSIGGSGQHARTAATHRRGDGLAMFVETVHVDVAGLIAS